MKTERRRQRGAAARRRGAWAEQMAVLYLRLKGYRVLERNWRSKMGEIDILAQKGRLLVLVEVKTRGDAALASESILAPQRRRLLRALQHYLQVRPHLGGHDLRCDLIALGRFGWPRHVTDAWRPAN